jgi:O-methyltransferase
MRTVKGNIRRLLKRFGWKIVRDLPEPVVFAPLEFWLWDDEFKEYFYIIHKKTMVDMKRCYMLYQLCKHVKPLPGEAAEVGVWRGGTGKLISRMLPDKKVYLCDTFEGLPPIVPEYDQKYHREGQFNDVDFKEVEQFFKKSKNVTIIKGIFPDSVKNIDMPRQYSLVHVDVDLYKPAMDCCDYFYDSMVKGGMMIFDDYGFRTCPGVKTAVEEFCERKGIASIYLPSGQCLIIKN